FVLSLIDDILEQIPPKKKNLNIIKQTVKQILTPLEIILIEEIQRLNLLTSIMCKQINIFIMDKYHYYGDHLYYKQKIT
ncbi:unnamed protein product, partial [Rotaria sp. Silwood2]